MASVHNLLCSCTALIKAMIISLVILSSTRAIPRNKTPETPEQTAQRHQLNDRILGIDSDYVNSRSRNNILPVTPFPAISLESYVKGQKPVDNQENVFDLPLDPEPQFQSVNAPKDPFSITKRQSVQSGQHWPWPTPPPIPRLANRNQRDIPLPLDDDQSSFRYPGQFVRPSPMPVEKMIPVPPLVPVTNFQEIVLDPQTKPKPGPSANDQLPSPSRYPGRFVRPPQMPSEKRIPVPALVPVTDFQEIVLDPQTKPKPVPSDNDQLPSQNPSPSRYPGRFTRPPPILVERRIPVPGLVPVTNLQEVVFDPKHKPGRCPLLFGGVKMCHDSCKGDEDCDGFEKCCWDGCEHACVAPEK